MAASLMRSVALQAKASAVAESDLSLKPPAQCNGAGRPAPTRTEIIHAENVGAPAITIDLNGDGWCDWITDVPYPKSTGLPEFSARDAILLGSEKGARTFGDVDKIRSFWKKSYPCPKA